MMNHTSNTIGSASKTLEEVLWFNYLGRNVSKDGTCNAEIRTRIATAGTTRLERIWKGKITFQSNFKLYKSLVLCIHAYGCDIWRLFAGTGKRMRTFQNKSLRKLLRISYCKEQGQKSRRLTGISPRHY